MSGYSEQELIDIQQRYKVQFPPDLTEIYRERRSVIPRDDFDWVKTPRAVIEGMLAWPLEGMLFDIENNAFWLPEWGERPNQKSDREKIACAAIAAAPKLIPVYGHRYIPEEPHARGNPIFSVYQTDIIYYGANLAAYVLAETHKHRLPEAHTEQDVIPSFTRIRFWSRFTDDFQ
jgi:hypothetical protein